MSDSRPIAYILGSFPQSSQTFIAREIRGLLRVGLPLQIMVRRRLQDDNLEPEDRAWLSLVESVPFPLAPAIVSAHAVCLVASPRLYVAAARALLRLPHRPRYLYFRALYLLWLAPWIARRIQANGGASLVHAHFAHGATELAMAVAALLDVPYSFTAHARDIYGKPNALGEKIRGAKRVVTCTDFNRRYLAKLCADVPPGRVVLVHHGIDACAIDTAKPDFTAPPLVLTAGRLVEKKGLEDLIAAAAILHRDRVPMRVVIAGSGPLSSALELQIRAAGLHDVVTLCGWQPATELRKLYGAATVFALPSRVTASGDRDGIPNVILEAMAHQLPVVSTTVSGIPEVVTDGVTGLLVAPQDPPALAAAIRRVIADSTLAHKLGVAGRKRAVADFDLYNNAQTLAEVLLAPRDVCP